MDTVILNDAYTLKLLDCEMLKTATTIRKQNSFKKIRHLGYLEKSPVEFALKAVPVCTNDAWAMRNGWGLVALLDTKNSAWGQPNPHNRSDPQM